MNFPMEKMLEFAAEVQAFCDPQDELSDVIVKMGLGLNRERELDVLELDLVCAAGSGSYQRFMEIAKERYGFA